MTCLSGLPAKWQFETVLLCRDHVLSFSRMYCMCCFQARWAPIPDSAQACTVICPSDPEGILPVVNNTTPTLTADTSAVMRHAAVLTPVEQRMNPLPTFEWADSRQMWETMMSKEDLPGYQRDIDSWFSRHALLQPRMRTTLLDWLMEVIVTFYINCIYLNK